MSTMRYTESSSIRVGNERCLVGIVFLFLFLLFGPSGCSDEAGSPDAGSSTDVRNVQDLHDDLDGSVDESEPLDVAEEQGQNDVANDLVADLTELDGGDALVDVEPAEQGADLPSPDNGGDMAPVPCDPVPELLDITCGSDADCGNDSYCGPGGCTRYNTGERCDRHESCYLDSHGDPPELAVQCEYNTPAPEVSLYETTGVGMTPMVADLDGDGASEIIFVELSPDLINAGYLTAIHGEDCSVAWQMPGDEHRYWAESQLAVGDLTGDGHPDVVAQSWSDATLTATDHEGNHLWEAHDEAGVRVNIRTEWGGSSLADLDHDGIPEVIAISVDGNFDGVYVLRADGELWWEAPIDVTSIGTTPVIADVDNDGDPEIITGGHIFGPTGVDETPVGWADFPVGHVAVADFDRSTEEPEIVVVWTPAVVGIPESKFGEFRMFRLDGSTLIDMPIPGYGMGGPPNVADFDGDGRPEVGVVNSVNYVVYDLDCADDGGPLPVECDQTNILWTRLVQDRSGSTAASAFDFGADGHTEILYNDECFLRVMNGNDGSIVAIHANSNGTTFENPIVADVDGDFNTEIVIAGASVGGVDCTTADPDTLTEPERTYGITVFHSPNDRWVNSRAIWNQHAYHITNVNDDGTIPAVEENNWESFNSYRRNVQVEGKDLMAPDLTVQIVQTDTAECPSALTVTLNVANRGNYPVGRGIPVDITISDTVVCTTETTGRLFPGQFERLSCRIDAPGGTSTDVTIRVEVDSRGDGSSVNTECVEENNWAEEEGVSCF